MRKSYHKPQINATEANRSKCFKEHGIKDKHDPYREFWRIDFEQFRAILMLAVMADMKARRLKGSSAGRSGFDPVFMLMVVFIQVRFNWCDEMMESMMRRDLCLKAFLGTWHPDDIPSASTIWRYREMLSKHKAFEHLLDDSIEIARSFDADVGENVVGIDSSFVTVPIQRNTPEENDIIKAGKGHTLWNDNPHKKAHKDINAQWASKGDDDFFGYKCHGVVCLRTKLIVNMAVTAANVHDSVMAPQLIRCLTPHPENIRSYGVAKGSPCFFADAGYKSKKIEEEIAAMGWDAQITERKWRGHPLTDEQLSFNKLMNAIRCRIEHVFGYIERSMGGFKLRSVGKRRAKSGIAAICFVYNMCTMLRLAA